jgi:peptidyl-prolyl cis-trans isomerase D
VTDEALTTWMAANTEAVDQEYQRQRHRYTDLEEQVRARHILVRVDETASEEDRNAARAEAEALLRRVQAGEDFAALAREHSDDEGSAVRGGDLGFFPRGRMVDAFEEAAFGLQDGQVTEELVQSQFGFHIIKREARREGDVPVEEAKRELAEGLFRRARAGELAQEDAQRALAYVREGHTMEELDERLRNNWSEAPAPEAEAEEEAPAEGGEEEGGEETASAEEPEAERDPNAPQVRETSPFGRGERAIQGPFDSSPLTQAAFEMTTENPLPEEPVQLGDDWFVYRLDERTEATREGFTDEVRERLEQSLIGSKRHEVLSAYIGRLRARAESEGEIRPNPEILQYPDEDGEEEEGEEESASL